MKTYLIKFLLCLAAGGLSSLAMAPLNLWPVLFVGLGVLYLILTKPGSPAGAFGLGWTFGFGYFIFSLSWVGNALLIEGNPYKWVWPLAVCGLPALLAFFPAFACLLARKFSNLKTLPGFLAFAAWLALFEWTRGHVFTGFPWNLFGYTWADVPQILQVVSISNVYVLTWLTILWMTLPFFLFAADISKKAKVFTALCAVLVFAVCVGFGAWRMETTPVEYHKDIDIRIVQPSIKQEDKWNKHKIDENFQRMIELSKPDKPSGKITYIVWPETALSHWFMQDPRFMQDIQTMLASYWNPAYVLTGMLRYNAQTESYYNSLVMIDRDGKISNIYNKHHLVPFGEYIPYQEWIPLKPIVQFTGFVKGDGPAHFETPEGLTYSPLVCYEVIFPGAVTDISATLPDFIVNVTNDAWYGISAGPYQHYTQAVFRAVEEGVPLVRAANTGLSGVIYPLGYDQGQTELFQPEAETLPLPKKTQIHRLNPLYTTIVFIVFLFVSIVLGYMQENRFALRR